MSAASKQLEVKFAKELLFIALSCEAIASALARFFKTALI